jgi:hypothetical protein
MHQIISVLDHVSACFTLASVYSEEEIMENDGTANQMKFESVLQSHVPKGRDGKHKQIITQLLAEIAKLAQGTALKIPLSQLPDTKENIRSALAEPPAKRRSTWPRRATTNLSTSGRRTKKARDLGRVAQIHQRLECPLVR